MSVQVGLRYFDGRVVARPKVQFLLQGLTHRAPDYAHIHLSNSVGMGFRGLLIAPEDNADQPLLGRSGAVITFDGRLDNRDEIASRLSISLSLGVSDGLLSLAVYERWGREGFTMLKGEFACAIWDAQCDSVFFLRSLCGTRPLYYITTGRQITWSSELDDLIIKSNIDPLVNDVYAIDYVYQQPEVNESPFQNVSVVPPGTCVEVKAGKFSRPIAMWHPERISTLQLGSDDAYEDAWRHHVKCAITSKLRTRDPIFCELSGGLDSTTLVFLSDEILRDTGRNPSELTTVSFTFEVSTTCDESNFIELAERTRGRAGIHIPESMQRSSFGLNDTVFTGAPNAHRFAPGRYAVVAEAMRSVGARVLLTGIGGDHLFWSDQGGSPELADLLVEWHFRSVMAQSREWSRIAGLPLWQILLTHAIAPVAKPGRFARWIPSGPNVCPWMTHKVRERLVQAARNQGWHFDQHIQLPSRRIRAGMVRSLQSLLSTGCFQGYAGIYFCHPYSNQQLIDFVLSLPMHQLVRPGQDRFLMRSATRGVIPEGIRTRKSKATIGEVPCRVMEREQSEIKDTAGLEVCQRGYADPRSLTNSIRAISMGRSQHSYALLRLLNLEQWLRSLHTIGARRRAMWKENNFAPLPAADLVTSSSE